jgi:hypothetical protein
MPSFKVPCPSCEHQVLITNASHIGTKVECPKCKYRFKVEEPAGGVPKDDAKGDKGKKKKAVAAGDSKKKESKKVVAIVVGALAVGLLAVVGFAMMGGDKKSGGGGGYGGGGGGGGGGGDDVTNPEDKKREVTVPTKKNPNPPSDKDERATTNLLPPQTVALARFDIDKVRQTPLATLFDPVTMGMFQSSFGIDANNVDAYYHALVGEKTREPFGVIRLKEPVSEKEVTAKMALADAGKGLEIKKRKLYTFKSNAFVNGVSNAGSFSSLLADVYEKSPRTAGKDKPIGVCVYDTQHILVGDHALLRQFLAELDDKGFPKFGDTAQLAENKMYLSINSELKRTLKGLGSEVASPPAFLFVERVNPALYDTKSLKADFQPVAAIVEPVLRRTEYAAVSVTSFTGKGLEAAVRLVTSSEGVAVEVAKDHLTPALTDAVLPMSLFLNTWVEFRNYTSGGMPPLFPGGNPAFPGGAPIFPGGNPRGSPDGGGGAGFIQPGPAPGPGPGRGMPMGIPMYGGGGQPEPGVAPGPGSPMTTDPNQLPPSYVDLYVSDHDITIAVKLNWSDDTYRRLIAPRVLGFINTVKGKMAVFASDLSYHALSAAVPRMTAATKQFPRGTADRKLTDANRMGLKYPPQSRVSFFAELLPYIDRGALAVMIDKDLAWYDEKNLAAAESWVPELLVPLYPQPAWRATSPLVTEGRVMGGTNYVGIAGVGRDAPRYDPANTALAKKLGIAGYDWGSKVEEVTDGLDKTIYLMQTPPGLQQPWLAGGGATIRGLDEDDPMRGFRHTFGTPGGKEGTFALMGDGSVRFIPGDIKKDKLLAMATRAGGEDLSDIDTHAPLVSTSKKKEAELKTELKADATPPKPADPKAADPTTPTTKIDSAPEPRDKK